MAEAPIASGLVMETPRLLILGTWLLAPEIADVASDAGYEVAGFVENLDRARCEEEIEGLPVHWIDELDGLVDDHLGVCGLGTTKRGRIVGEAAERGLRFATVVHPTARVSSRSTLGEGCIVGPGAVIATRTELGRHVLVNRGALIGHDTRIGNYCSIQPGSNVAGACAIGDATWVGIGAVVIDKLTVGSHCVIGAGAVVTRDVPDGVTVVGVPARVIRESPEGR